MKRIKVIATLFILFSASLMNYHHHSVASVNFCNGSELIVCADSKEISGNPAPDYPDCQASPVNPSASPVIDDPGSDQPSASGKFFASNMVIM